MKRRLFVVITLCWFQVLAACGSHTDTPETSKTPTTENIAATNGEEVYQRYCSMCHQPDGKGVPGNFPPMVASDYLKDRTATIKLVINGKSGEMTVNGARYNGVMPPQSLNDAEVAAVLTYVYNHFNNTTGTVTAAEVASARAGR